MPFLADHVIGVELERPMMAAGDVPPVAGRTVFAFVPERLGELEVVRAARPGGTAQETRYRGELLFVTDALG